MEKIIIGPDNPVLSARLHNWHDQGGWYFGAGDPEFWQFSNELLKPGGKLLDIGIGLGRSSFYFAAHGMDVLGVDTDESRVADVNQMAAELKGVMPFDMKALRLDALQEDLPEGLFDTIIIGQVVHIESKQAAFDLFYKALAALKPGGHIWVRGAGKESYAYEELSYYAYSGLQPSYKFIDNDVIEHPCNCSGEDLIEPTLFFDPLDLSSFFASRGCTIVHSQTIPTEDKMNIMYGEDYNPDYPNPMGGMVTVMARKPLNRPS